MVQVQGMKVILTGSGLMEQAIETPTAMLRLQTQPFYQIWHWEVIVVGNLSLLMDAILAGESYAVSNGSFQLGKGATAWIVEGCNNTNQIIGTCLSPSDGKGHSSFCSKLAGIYAIMFTLFHMIPNKAMKPHFQITCNSKLVLARLKWLRMIDPQEPHVDLLLATCNLIKHSVVKIELHHVKGHQDSNQIGPFTHDATLNIKADLLAKTKLSVDTLVPTYFHILWS